MQLKKGYKQTEVGVIPEDWEPKNVGSKGEVRAGKALAARGLGRQRPYLRTKNVFDGRIDLDDVLRMPMTETEFSLYRLRHGDVLLNEGQSIELVGRCAMYRDEYPEPCAIQNQLIRFRAHENVDGGFATHLFRNCQAIGVFSKIAMQTTSVAHLGVSRFCKLRLAWPREKAEQKAIAGALSDADAWIESLEQLIAKKRQIKQGAMQELLTGKRRLPGFNDEWERKRLGDCCRFLRNGTNSRADLQIEGAVKYLHYGDIHSCGSVYMSPALLPSLPAFKANTLDRLEDGDLVLADASEDTIGISKSVEIVNIGKNELVSGLHTIPVRFSKGMFASGFAGYLQHCPEFTSHLRRLAAGTKVYATNRRHVASVEMRIPSQDEQTAIAAVLADMDSEITALETKLTKARQIKQGMMQELLTGRIRLVEPTREQQ